MATRMIQEIAEDLAAVGVKDEAVELAVMLTALDLSRTDKTSQKIWTEITRSLTRHRTRMLPSTEKEAEKKTGSR